MLFSPIKSVLYSQSLPVSSSLPLVTVEFSRVPFSFLLQPIYSNSRCYPSFSQAKIHHFDLFLPAPVVFIPITASCNILSSFFRLNPQVSHLLSSILLRCSLPISHKTPAFAAALLEPKKFFAPSNIIESISFLRCPFRPQNQQHWCYHTIHTTFLTKLPILSSIPS